ncbi:hypothetical protein COC42_00930 [Sphingomonas spermidinifaciens]|uniref:Uncharacterized protein n=2 Tax=Sphingomonas spermidinifaciens TaxID=1141889 RepID=A0A2A4B5V8_9SPHN|nr:hypothetical protein COC42_00930 [Sphingomonas spermidinifaciens]
MMLASGAASDDRSAAPLGAVPFALGLRLVPAEARTPRLPRIAAEALPLDLLPGDRPAADLCADTTERPREPGAPVRARMSMRLDSGRDAMRPAFALGGLGGALMRVTDALLDD